MIRKRCMIPSAQRHDPVFVESGVSHFELSTCALNDVGNDDVRVQVRVGKSQIGAINSFARRVNGRASRDVIEQGQYAFGGSECLAALSAPLATGLAQ